MSKFIENVKSFWQKAKTFFTETKLGNILGKMLATVIVVAALGGIICAFVAMGIAHASAISIIAEFIASCCAIVGIYGIINYISK